jgi:hypothetical protein
MLTLGAGGIIARRTRQRSKAVLKKAPAGQSDEIAEAVTKKADAQASSR